MPAYLKGTFKAFVSTGANGRTDFGSSLLLFFLILIDQVMPGDSYCAKAENATRVFCFRFQHDDVLHINYLLKSCT